MANDVVRFTTGLETNLSSELKEKGKVLFAITGDDKGYIYFDKDNNTRIKMSEHATTAQKDSANNLITSTYVKGLSVNGTTLTIIKGDNSSSTITLQDINTDERVRNELNTTTKAYITGTPSAKTNIGFQFFDTGVYLDNIAGQLVATTFKGALDGNAATATKATNDGAGNVITTHYIKHGSISVSDTNHNMTYTNGASGDTKTVDLPFVKLSGDTMTGNLTTSGNMTAVKFIGDLQGNADSASTLTHKTLNNTTLNNTAGSFAFSGSNEPWTGTDWVGLQIGDNADKFQIVGSGNTLLFRQNDNGGTNTSWNGWVTLPYIPQNTAKGSTTKGVYIKNTGEVAELSYELKATVNNATQWGVAYYSTTTNITSTAAGGANTALMGKGSAAPAFVSVNPTLTLTAGTTAGPKVKISVLGINGTDLTLPTATNTASGVVTTGDQTWAGAKTFNNPIKANAAGDSSYSTHTAASLVVTGGVSVAKNLSAKTVRIDNNQTNEGVSLQYNESLDTLNFVFV